MSWVRVECDYPRHLKTLRLVRRLGPIAELYPLRLMLWAGEQRPDGSLAGVDDEEIAHIAGYAGDDPGELVRHLRECGFVETDRDGSRRLRSWYEHNGILADRRERNAERMRRQRAAANEESEQERGAPEAQKPDAEPVQIPAELNTAEFLAAWSEWFAYRRERKLKPWAARTINGQLARLSKLGPERAVAAIRNSIDNGYQGIFEASASKSAPAGARSLSPDEQRYATGAPTWNEKTERWEWQ